MQSIKEQALRMLRNLPDDCSMDDIKYQIYLLDAVEEGLRAADQGHFVSQDEAERRMKEWLASYGQTQP